MQLFKTKQLFIKHCLYSFVVLLLLNAGTAVAELTINVSKPPVDEHDIGEVNLESTTGAYSVITDEKIQGRYADLSSVIENEIGVQVRSFGGLGSFSTAVLRGASSEQVVVYLDGVALNDASSGSFNLSNIAVENIDRIEVYRGVTPIELGGASIGGAINIITKKAEPDSKNKQKANVKVSLGNLSIRKLSAEYSASEQRNNLLASAEYLYSDNDYEIPFDNGTQFNTEDDFRVSVNNDQVEQSSVLLKWEHLLDDKTSIDTRLKLFDKDKGIPSKNNSPDVTTSYETQSYDVLGQFTKKDFIKRNIDFNLKLDLYGSDELYDDQLAQLGSLQEKISYQNQRTGAQAYFLFNGLNTEQRILFGASNETFEFQDEFLHREKSRNDREILELNFEHRAFFLYRSLVVSLGYRFQEITDSLDYAINTFGDNVEQDDQNYSVSDPQLGFRYDVNSSISMTANIGRYTRIPTFFELFGDQGLFIGNEDLEKETSINSDIGLTYTFINPGYWLDDAVMYFGLFHNESDDLIIRSYNGLGTGVSENLSSAVIDGFEYQLKLYPSKNWLVNFNMTLLNSVLSSDVNNFDNNSLPGQYGQSYSLYTSYQGQGWTLSLQQSYKREMYFERGNDHDGQNIYTADLSILKRWKQQSIEFQVMNLTDENHIQFNSRPLPGAIYLITCQYYFNEVN